MLLTLSKVIYDFEKAGLLTIIYSEKVIYLFQKSHTQSITKGQRRILAANHNILELLTAQIFTTYLLILMILMF